MVPRTMGNEMNACSGDNPAQIVIIDISPYSAYIRLYVSACDIPGLDECVFPH